MSKADEIRRLLKEGKSRSETARLAGTSYQQVYQVDKKLQGGHVQRRDTGVVRSSGRGYWGSSRQGSGYGGGYGTDYVPSKVSFGQERYAIRTGPSQVVVATQDGHGVLLTEDAGGKICANCLQPIMFSAGEMTYVHTSSRAPITGLTPMQTGPGLFDGRSLPDAPDTGGAA